MMSPVKAMVLTGYGLNCDYETDYSLRLAGAEPHRIHINELIRREAEGAEAGLDGFHILVFGGGFSWADDHGAGVLLASKMRSNAGDQIQRFIERGKLVIGICNGFQALVNLGLLPAFDGNIHERRVALTYNDSGNFVDTWVRLRVNADSPCIFTRGLGQVELPIRHGEGKFYASEEDVQRLFRNRQVVMQYADERGDAAGGRSPFNPNGSLGDIAGICDPTGRIFGLMPHPEAFHDLTNHPNWTLRKEALKREGKEVGSYEGEGVRIFRNAVEYARKALAEGRMG